MQRAISADSVSTLTDPTELGRLHTLALASAAYSKIRQFKLAYSPRNYKVWYVYEAGTNSELCDDLSRVMSTGLGVTPDDMDRLHDAHFPKDAAERIDEVGAGIKAEIDAVATIAANGALHAQLFGACLDSASQNFPDLSSDNLGSVVTGLIAAVKETARLNRDAIDRLARCSHQISCLRTDLNTAQSEIGTDALTGLANRKRFYEQFSDALAEATASRQPLSVVMIDIDHFKTFNDRFGHMIGDQVLRLVGASIRQHIRGSDLAARYGGEEFAVVLPHAAAVGARQVAEAIRKTIFAKPLKRKSNGETLGQVTVSLGVATLREGLTAEQMIELADQCLYAAKRAGRNRVVVAEG